MKFLLTFVKIFSIIILVVCSGIINCSNPTEEKKKKTQIRILVDDYLEGTGLYVFYWDGKDKNGKYIKAGRYIYEIQTKTFQDFDYFSAIDGGKEGENNEEHFEPGFWNDYELQKAYPDPFKIVSGVNIPFLVSEPARVRVIIYKD